MSTMALVLNLIPEVPPVFSESDLLAKYVYTYQKLVFSVSIYL